MRLIAFPIFALAILSPLCADERAERLFSVEVKPLLSQKCFACHGGAGVKLGDLDLTTRAAMLAGGASGKPALAPGESSRSPLYTALTWADADLQMPPKENDRLSERQAWKIRDWIDAGAPWPDETTQARYVAESLSRGAHGRRRAREDQRRPLRRVDQSPLQARRSLGIPTRARRGAAAQRRRSPDRRLPPGEAARDGALPRPACLISAPLLRRAFLDLTGLPPTPEETKAFLEDDAPDAWEELIDRLLASPHYGERWGQHWLDVARYADTAGNSNDYERSNAWRYRDYVIRAFNQDKPYNRFIVEQLAGDELAPDNPEMLVATGFLRMGPWGSAMVPKKIARQAYLDERGQQRRTDVPGDAAALRPLPRPQVRPHPHTGLLPLLRGLRRHADGGEARRLPARRELVRFRERTPARPSAARVCDREERVTERQDGGRRPRVVRRARQRVRPAE